MRRVINQDVKMIELESEVEINARLQIFKCVLSVLEDIQLLMGHEPSKQF